MTNLPLQDRIALVTGASRGIGAAIAKRYASLGAHVVMVARSVDQMEAVDDAIQKEGNGQATLVPLDLRDVDKIDQLALTIAERFGRLDILVGNAAILGGLRPVTSVSNKIWDEVIAINVTTNHRLIRSFHPLLQQSDHGRAIFVTSGVTHQITAYWGAYTTSKTALNTLVQTYAREIEQSNVKVNLVEPGMVHTDMLASAFPGQDMNQYPNPEDITDIFVKLASESCTHHGEILSAT